MEAHQVDVLKKRLRELNTHQASIQTLSLWIAHHHKDCEKIAKIWAQEVCTYNKGGSDWLLAAFYVANDVIQNSRNNKTPEIVSAFFQPLKTAVRHVGQNKDKIPEKAVSSIERVIKIFGERNVYTAKQIDELTETLTGSQKNKDLEARKLKKYENDINERLRIRNKTFGDAIDSIKALMDPPSEDAKTRQLIRTYPESIADPKSLCPKTFDEVHLLLTQTTDAHRVVSDYAKSVKDEKARTNELQKQLAFVDNLLTIESRLSKELLFKSQNCMNLLYKKRDKLKQQKEMLPDDPTWDSGPLPDLAPDDL